MGEGLLEEGVHYFPDESGEWRWHLVAANHKIVGTSGEGYNRRGGAVDGFHVVCTLVGGNPANVPVHFSDDDPATGGYVGE